jgi:hypothetical protein
MRKGLRAKEISLESFCTWISLLHLISTRTLWLNSGDLFGELAFDTGDCFLPITYN